MKKVFSFDAETDGLWGRPFAIAAIVYENGQETARFIARMSDSVVTNPWVRENVLPALANVPVTHPTRGIGGGYYGMDTDAAEEDCIRRAYEAMIADFSVFYMQHKEGADVIAHMGYIVEAHLIREMHRLGFIGDWDAPYPLFDVSGNLQAAGEDPTSVDAYAKKHNLEIADHGATHNPLYDCEVAARVYMHLLGCPAQIAGNVDWNKTGTLPFGCSEENQFGKDDWWMLSDCGQVQRVDEPADHDPLASDEEAWELAKMAGYELDGQGFVKKSPQPQYRPFKGGEVIEEGDQFRAASGKWKNFSDHVCNETISPFMLHRSRKLVK